MATCWRARARLALCAHLAAGRQAWRAAGAHVKQGGAELKQRRKRGGCAIRHEGTAGAGAHRFSPLRHGRPHGRHRRLSGSLGPAAPCARWPLRTAARGGPSRWPCRLGCSRTPRGSGRTCGSRRAPQRRLREEGRQRGEDGIRCWSQPVIRRHRQQQVVQRQAMQGMRLGWRRMRSTLVVNRFPSPGQSPTIPAGTRPSHIPAARRSAACLSWLLAAPPLPWRPLHACPRLLVRQLMLPPGAAACGWAPTPIHLPVGVRQPGRHKLAAAAAGQAAPPPPLPPQTRTPSCASLALLQLGWQAPWLPAWNEEWQRRRQWDRLQLPPSAAAGALPPPC